MIIRNQPESLSLSGNLRHLVVRSTGDLTLTIKEAGAEDPFLQQIYTPDNQGNVDIDLKDIVIPRLSVIIEDTADAYRQMSVVKTFVVGLKDDERTDTVSFAVLRAGVAQLPDGDTANFLQQHFLTWQPTLKQVTYYTPEFLTYYAVVASVIKCRTTVIDSGNQNQRTITLASINAGECWTVPVGYSVIAGKINDLPSYYEVWVEDAHGERLTDIQQYAASDMKSEEEQWILFENSLGGVDTFRAYGTYEAIADHAHHVAEMSELQQEYRVDTVRKYKKSTGFLGRHERLWLLDFFPSMGKYLHTGSMIRRIVVTESEVDYNAKELPSEYTFTYRYAESVPYLNINRTAVDISTLNITVPDIGSFTVAPRLVEFPRTPLSDGALIPVQSPYSESWGATTMAAVLSWILRHADIPASKYSEDFLSKIYDDVAAGTISFMKGLISHGRSVFRGVAEFLNGINVEGDADISGNLTTGGDIHTTGTLSVDGNAELKGDLSVNGSLTAKVIRQDVMMSTNYSGDGIGDKGWKLTNNDGSGRSKLTVDRLYVRQDFATETLQVKRSYVTSGNHVDSAAANTISRTDYLKLDSTTGEYDIIGYKRIKVPFIAKQWIMMLSKFQIRGIFSRTKMIRVPVAVQDINRIRCYFLANDGNKKIDNNWVVGDLVRCQTYNITGQWRRNTWITQIGDSHTGNVFWWRKVVAVSNAPVEIDGMQYHYFDVAMGDCAENSTIPAEGDDVCQWGHVSNPERMNVIVHEVTGNDAPAVKSYEGIYCYDMSKSWFGGNTKKMNLSPKTEYLFNGRKFRIETDYGVQPISVDRGEWDNINQEPDDYEPTEMVRKCYYGDKVTHNGCYWRCILSNNGEHWVDDSGQYISDVTYDSLTPEEKATCTRKQNYTIDEPTENSDEWEKQVDRGEKGQDGASPNINILLRTIFDKGLSFVREKWESYPLTKWGQYIYIDDAQDTVVNGRKSLRINASTLTSQDYVDVAQNVYGKLKPSTWYTLSFNSYSTQQFYTYIWSHVSGQSIVDLTEGLIVDGVNRTTGADGYVIWPAAWDGKRHSVTFKTVATFPTEYIDILFRAFGGCQVAFCMPKLEEGKTATAYMANDDDLIGENGKDGWMITANPANVILTQALTNASASFSTATVSFTAKKGSASATISSIGTPTSEEFNVAKKGSTGDDAKKVLVSGPKTHGTPAEFYTEGSFVVTLNVIDPDSGNNITFSVTVLCYANPLGVWQTKIEGDVETSVAKKIEYAVNGTTGQVDGYVALGNFKRSSEENISKLQKDTVKANQLPIGGWRLNDSGYSAADYDKAYDRSYDEALTTNDIYSPVIALSEGDYCFSGYVPSGRSFDTYGNTIQVVYGCSAADPGSGSQYINAKSVGELTGDTIKINGNIYIKRYAVFSIPATAMCSINIWGSTGYGDVAQPKIVAGTTPDVDTTMSVINQTAEDIEFSVNDGLQRTGIDIENGLIKLDADKVKVSGNLRSASVGTLGASGNKIEIDDSTFKVYNSAGIVGLEIGWDSDGNPFLVLRDRTGRDGYKLTYSSIGNASADFTNDEFSAMKLYQLVNGRTYDNLEISEFFSARRDPSEPLIDPNYYMYSAAKNLSTDVYKIDDYDYDGSHREYTDGKTFDINDLSDVLGVTPDNYMIPDGYYINDMITGDNHQGRFGPVYQKNLYQAAQGVLSVVGSICFIGVYDDREEEWSYYFTRDIEGTGTRTTIFTASDYLF